MRTAPSPAAVLALALALSVALASAGCAETFPRHLAYQTVESVSLRGREMTYAVYTPPGFAPDERLPIVVFLHGGGDDAASFDRAGLSTRLDEATLAGRIPRVVIALPQGDLGFWTDWYDGSARYESWVLEEVLPRVAHDFHTLVCPEDCHVMGVSMGGSGTLRFALRHPERWASATLISAPLLDTDQMISLVEMPLLVPIVPMDRIFGPTDDRARVERDDPYLRWRDPADLGGMRLMVTWGDRDRGAIVETNRAFRRHLEERGVPHVAQEFDGDHSWRAWNPVIEDALRRMVSPSPWARGPGLSPAAI
jgi:enterochelin esterase-like enzyme